MATPSVEFAQVSFTVGGRRLLSDVSLTVEGQQRDVAEVVREFRERNGL